MARWRYHQGCRIGVELDPKRLELLHTTVPSANVFRSSISELVQPARRHPDQTEMTRCRMRCIVLCSVLTVIASGCAGGTTAPSRRGTTAPSTRGNLEINSMAVSDAGQGALGDWRYKVTARLRQTGGVDMTVTNIQILAGSGSVWPTHCGHRKCSQDLNSASIQIGHHSEDSPKIRKLQLSILGSRRTPEYLEIPKV